MTMPKATSLHLTKKQYWHLMRAVYMADWMANAICERDMKEDKGIGDIRNHVFALAKDFGFEKYAEYSDDLKHYYATWDLDDEPSMRKLIDRYDDHAFWEEILKHLSMRDFERKYSPREIQAMTKEEYIHNTIECENKWSEELEMNGVDRLEIIKTTIAL